MHQKLIDELFAVRDELQAKLSLSEKRAEELAIELVHEHAEIEALAAERDSAKSSLARVVEKMKMIESECENSLTGRLPAHYYLANIHAQSRSALHIPPGG